ncbi:MAG: 3-hydroxyacyl-ACP dehydratase FabZ [Oscillospiraceae bacterium]|nr:3-hydroxyacyl-ACP dehydratase FabZ [Oscillospiraceae bacterium]
MNRDEIKAILPHREPMLLLDRAELDAEGRALGFYTVRGDEWFLQGHFPGNPIVPGVIQCEMMAQSCCLLLADQVKGKLPLFTGLDKVRFKRPVVPGDTLEFVCSGTGGKGPFRFAEGTGSVGGKLCVKASMSFALVEKGEADQP